MRIYLDTKDLINIIEKSEPISPQDLKKNFIEKANKLIISNMLLLEVSEPLNLKSKKTNVMKFINKLETIPHEFIKTKNLYCRELIEAIKSFNNNKEYKDVNPFTSRYTEVLELSKKFPLEKFIIYSLGEAIWIFFNEGVLGGYNEYIESWKNMISIERKLFNSQNKKENFVGSIIKHLSHCKIQISSHCIKPFGEWIYKEPYRCPSIRLINEVFSKMVQNIGDIPKESDLEDFVHIKCLPYVDFMTVDRRFHGYICQAANSLGIDYKSKLIRSIDEILW